MGSNHEKNRGKKYCDTFPLIRYKRTVSGEKYYNRGLGENDQTLTNNSLSSQCKPVYGFFCIAVQ